MKTMKPDDVKPGDWVSFMAGNRLVIGFVHYVAIPSYGSYTHAFTDQGLVNLDSVLEVRSATKAQP